MLKSLFQRKPLLEPETVEWMFDVYAWAIDSFSAEMFYANTDLVLPTEDYFPIERGGQPDDVARQLFDKVKEYAGMGQWACELVRQEDDPISQVDSTVVVQGLAPGPAGTFSVREGVPVITYNPGQLKDPMSFVATMAHELAHYLAATAETAPPGGEAFEEYATDVLAVIIGYGVFLSNSAFHFNQYMDVNSQGWSTHSQGYLSQFELVFCLAIFTTLKELPPVAALDHLKPALKSYYKKCLKELDRRHADPIAALKRAQA